MTPVSRQIDPTHEASARELEDSIHALAQPLTALLFLLELDALNADPQVWRVTLESARTECLRAVKALEQIRNAAHALGITGDLS